MWWVSIIVQFGLLRWKYSKNTVLYSNVITTLLRNSAFQIRKSANFLKSYCLKWLKSKSFLSTDPICCKKYSSISTIFRILSPWPLVSCADTLGPLSIKKVINILQSLTGKTSTYSNLPTPIVAQFFQFCPTVHYTSTDWWPIECYRSICNYWRSQWTLG